MTRATERLAAVDLGTNSFRMVVADVDPRTGHFVPLAKAREMVRLGRGATDFKRLTPAAMARGIATLKRFKALAAHWRAPIRAVATSAVREALNRAEFIRRARAVGVTVEVASGAEEARLIHLGALQALPVYDSPLLLVDIGGGSMEWLVARRRDIRYAHSLKLGAIRVTERFLGRGTLKPEDVKACRDALAALMGPAVRRIRREHWDLVVGTAGTVCTLARMIKVRRRDPSPLNGTVITRADLDEVAAEILGTRSLEARRALRGLDPARADIIPAGALVLQETFRALGIRRMRVSEYALREGLLLDTVEKRRGRRFERVHEVRRRSVLSLAERCRYDASHARRVAALALAVFDQTAPLHGLGAPERGLLEAAALLHDVGVFVSTDQHHRHGYYLIRNADLLGFTDDEKEVVANVARYHRKSHPKPRHEGFARLDPRGKVLVRRLAGMLRVADALDRGHADGVKGLACRLRKGEVAVALKARRGARLEAERWAFEDRKGLFEEAFGVRLRLRG